jgi:tRNA pseudouridine synthase 10
LNLGFKFASSGREDADVVMLGNGRPFYFELANPKTLDLTTDDIVNLQSQINEAAKDKVHVTNLQIVTRYSKDEPFAKAWLIFYLENRQRL